MKITRVHHLTIAVRDVDAARRTFEQFFGAEALDGVAPVPAFGVRAVDLALGDSALELVAPAEPDNPVMRFLERKGEGFYTLALEVEDLDAAVAELASRDVRVSEPVEAQPGLRSAFVTMAATHGLSVQLVQVLRDEAAPGPEPEPEPAPKPSRPKQASARRSAPAAEEPAAPPEAEMVPAAPAEPAGGAEPPLDLTPDEWSDVD